MAIINRLRVSWSGAPVVGPGLSTFYQGPGGSVGFADDIAAFFFNIAAQVVTGVQWLVPSNGETIDAATGTVTGTWSEPGTGGVVVSSGSAGFVNGTGARVVWNTGGVFAGRTVRGATFIVPLPTNSFEGAGNLTASAITALQDAANALVAAEPQLSIWSRPAGIVPGESNEVISASVPDAVSWLRSRRT